MTHTQGPCMRCRIETHWTTAKERFEHGTSDKYYHVIVYCPLHRAASDLLEVLKIIYADMERGHSINPYEYKARVGQAIAKAEVITMKHTHQRFMAKDSDREPYRADCKACNPGSPERCPTCKQEITVTNP